MDDSFDLVAPLQIKSDNNRRKSDILHLTPRGKNKYKNPVIEFSQSQGEECSSRKRKLDKIVTPKIKKTTDSPKPKDGKLNKKKFNFCGIAESVQTSYRTRKKITQLYEWQEDCLSDNRLLRGQNLIVSLPTGAGKTLVAEILMLREATVKRKSSILILPYVAIVQEKISSLHFFEEDFKVHIEEYASSKGRIPPIKRRNGVSIYIATIEKANMLMNSLIEKNQLDKIGLVVVDELHMLGDGRRGALLEQMLSKYLKEGIGQIVGMSATLSNMPQLSQFLRAYVYTTEFRPVKLNEFMKLNSTLYRVMPGGRTVVEKTFAPYKLEKKDPDGITQILQRLVPHKSALIFCPTKKNCENAAYMIAKIFPKSVRDHRLDEKKQLVEAIKSDNEGKIDEVMENCLLAGIGFHHSGLTHEERKHIEAAYCDGVICVICATSTLAAGVNLPARVVIIKSPYVGQEFIKKSQYLQMIGRSGRAGFDDEGDSITIVKPGNDERKFRDLLLSSIPCCNSPLADVSLLSAFVLDIITLKMANSRESLAEVINNTLLWVQKGEVECNDLVYEAVELLVKQNLISITEENLIQPTSLGLSAYRANFQPEEVGQLVGYLSDTLDKGVVFSSCFHLLYVISPYDVECAIDWDLFYREYKALSSSEKDLLASSGLPEHTILMRIQRKEKMKAGEPSMRLYIGLMLQKIWLQVPAWEVAKIFGVDRGWLSNTLQSSICQAAAISRFSEDQKPLWPLKFLLPELVKKLSDCTKVELVPLLSINGIKRARAQHLYSAGFKTVKDVANMDYAQLSSALGIFLRKHDAQKIINSAKALLRDHIDEKFEELEEYGITSEDVK